MRRGNGRRSCSYTAGGTRGATGIHRQGRRLCEESLRRDDSAGRQEEAARYVDVFCDRGAFTQEQAEKVLAAARKHGLGTRAHVCQFTSAELKPLLEYQPASFDHMDCVQPKDISLLVRERRWQSAARSKLFLGTKNFPTRGA